MKKMTEQPENKAEDDNFREMLAKKFKKMQHGATKEYLKLEIHQLVLKAEFVVQQAPIQSPPPQNVFRSLGNPQNFYSSTPYNSAARGQPSSTLDVNPPRNTDTYAQSRNYEQFENSTQQNLNFE